MFGFAVAVLLALGCSSQALATRLTDEERGIECGWVRSSIVETIHADAPNGCWEFPAQPGVAVTELGADACSVHEGAAEFPGEHWVQLWGAVGGSCAGDCVTAVEVPCPSDASAIPAP